MTSPRLPTSSTLSQLGLHLIRGSERLYLQIRKEIPQRLKRHSFLSSYDTVLRRFQRLRNNFVAPPNPMPPT